MFSHVGVSKMASKSRKCLTLLEKSEILQALNNGQSVTSLSKKYGIAKSTVCAIRNKKKTILKTIVNTHSGLGKRKTVRCSANPEMEQNLYKWFLRQGEKHIPVSGLMLKLKGQELYTELNGSDGTFCASDGWLTKFKKRFGIRLLKIPGEKLSSQPELISPFKNTLKATIEEHQLTNDQIYNADETGLFWKLLPDRTYVSTSEKTAPGAKSQKHRITFLACTNASGLHKVKPLIIGKTKNPRSFKNFRCPLGYTSSRTAWMTAAIFKKWFHENFIPQVSKFLKNRNLPIKALLLLDNASSHPPAQELKNEDGTIFAMFLPPNVTPIIQPMDQNIIRITKLFYRKNLLSSIMAGNPVSVVEAMKAVSMKDAVLNLALAWQCIDSDLIKKCWKSSLTFYEGDTSDNHDVPLSILQAQWSKHDCEYCDLASGVVSSTVATIVDLLKQANPDAEYTSDEIATWNDDNNPVDDPNDSGEESEGSVVEVQINKSEISDEKAIEACNYLTEWAEKRGVDYQDVLVLKKLHGEAVKRILMEKQKQT